MPCTIPVRKRIEIYNFFNPDNQVEYPSQEEYPEESNTCPDCKGKMFHSSCYIDGEWHNYLKCDCGYHSNPELQCEMYPYIERREK